MVLLATLCLLTCILIFCPPPPHPITQLFYRVQLVDPRHIGGHSCNFEFKQIFLNFSCFFLSFPLVDQCNPYQRKPSYDFWSPWVAPNSTQDRMVLNTEGRKVKAPPLPDGQDCDDDESKGITDEYIDILLCETSVSFYCKSCNIHVFVIFSSA